MLTAASQFQITRRSGTASEVLALAAPLIIANLSQSMMWVVDAFIMGRVGTAEQGAVGLGGVLVWAMICFFAGTLSVVSIMVAQDFGAGKHDLARHVRAGMMLAAPMGLLVLSLWPAIPSALGLFGVTSEVRPHAETYVQLRLLAAPLILGSFVFTSYLRGVGNTVVPMVVVLGANLVNALASVALVFGVAGLPKMGVAGAAVGTIIACAFELVALVAIFLFSRSSRAHGAHTLRLPRASELRDLLSVGSPIGLAHLFEMVAWTSFSIYAGTRPAAELAAHTVLFQVSGFCFMPAMGIGIAASTLVGQYLGAGRIDLARRSARRAVVIGVAYMTMIGTALALFRRPLLLAFTADPEVVLLGGTLALVAALYQPFDGLGIVVQGVLRGAKQTTLPTLIMLGSGMFVFIPLVWVLGERRGMGVTGAWIAAIVHVVVVAVLMSAAALRSRLAPATAAPKGSPALESPEALAP